MIFRVDLPPSIGSPPLSRTNAVGTTATFAVTVSGTLPLSYQWVKNGTSLLDGGTVSGANTATLTLMNVQASDVGNYSVVVINAFGSAISPVAMLIVDTDGDGVTDDLDQCPDTPPGSLVDEHGCSIAQLVPCEGPRPGVAWKNHAEYVRAVSGVVTHLVDEGIISEDEGRDIVVAAAQSDCGRK
jgi:hypothetical protein